ncbi:DUF4238 domain-containing protein [Calderihabitans maritimus]|uniref:DUF4238 domain-containing protein n=1 Tax=Calderihabitans maritimus TaxID=1246530 RepID=A0A1Z5HYJ3_9FIRM|nr:DUF4238 domain-containing protein [Calderihabitans maritimus]GAW94375.1 hypothetical protein KKC1_34810 [Calderihabitans maritimus]
MTKHHFIPRSYLAGFTTSGKKDDRLWVLDQETGKQWPGKPNTVAFQHDLYIIENADDKEIPPNALEQEFGNTIENKVAPIIKEITIKGRLPVGEEFVELMKFIALLFARTPSHRETLEKPLKEVGELILHEILATPERYKNTIEKMRKDGFEINEEAGYEDMKAFIRNGNYDICVNQNFYLKLLLHSANIIAPLLMERKWSLVITDDKFGGFICSDNPVSLVWTVPMPPFYSPGFGMLNTEITVPLSKNFALIGRFEGEAQVGLATKKTVASINSRTGMYSKRFVYSAKKDFIWINKNGQISTTADLIKAIQKKISR